MEYLRIDVKFGKYYHGRSVVSAFHCKPEPLNYGHSSFVGTSNIFICINDFISLNNFFDIFEFDEYGFLPIYKAENHKSFYERSPWYLTGNGKPISIFNKPLFEEKDVSRIMRDISKHLSELNFLKTDLLKYPKYMRLHSAVYRNKDGYGVEFNRGGFYV